MSSPCKKRRTIWLGLAVLVMIVLHQDFWFWDDSGLVLGFLPVGLAYHAGYSIVAASLWAAAMKFAWPTGIEAWAASEDENQ